MDINIIIRWNIIYNLHVHNKPMALTKRDIKQIIEKGQWQKFSQIAIMSVDEIENITNKK